MYQRFMCGILRAVVFSGDAAYVPYVVYAAVADVMM